MSKPHGKLAELLKRGRVQGLAQTEFPGPPTCYGGMLSPRCFGNYWLKIQPHPDGSTRVIENGIGFAVELAIGTAFTVGPIAAHLVVPPPSSLPAIVRDLTSLGGLLTPFFWVGLATLLWGIWRAARVRVLTFDRDGELREIQVHRRIGPLRLGHTLSTQLPKGTETFLDNRRVELRGKYNRTERGFAIFVCSEHFVIQLAKSRSEHAHAVRLQYYIEAWPGCTVVAGPVLSAPAWRRRVQNGDRDRLS